ncbi:MAG: J domain-containing protein [Gammaproteobacteria bacterium]
MINNKRNYYRILNVQHDAPIEVIKASYRTMMQTLKYHPDLGGDQWNAALLTEARRVLTDPLRREQYDRELKGAYSDQVLSAGPHHRENAYETVNRDYQIDAKTSQQCVFCGLPHLNGYSPSHDGVCSRCRCPLTTLPHIFGEEKGRAVDRFNRQGAIKLYSHWQQDRAETVDMLDLSPKGLSFRSTSHFRQGQILKVESDEFCATAHITHARQQTSLPNDRLRMYGAGFCTIQFVHAVGNFMSISI